MKIFKQYFEQYSRFIVGTSVIFMAELVLTIFLTEWFGWYFLKSYFISLMIGSFALQLFNKHVTFARIKQCSASHRFLCGIVTFLMYVADVLALYVISEVFLVNYIIGIIVITPPFSLLSFTINRQFMVHKDEPRKKRNFPWMRKR